MTSKKDDDCLTAEGAQGEQEITMRVIYKDDDDLADKLQAMSDSMSGDKKLFFNKPRWFDSYRVNCCGSSGP